MTATAPVYEAHRDMSCPFCGSEDSIRSSLYVDEGTELIPADDVGEIPTVHCKKCLAEAPVIVWNNRPDPWRYPPEIPADGQRIVEYYDHPEAGEAGPIIKRYHHDHQKEHCHPIVRWMPVPEIKQARNDQ